MFDLGLHSFAVLLATDWSDQADKELALGELDDGDAHGVAAVCRYFRQRLAARLHRMEE
jgi:hypothetical protein